MVKTTSTNDEWHCLHFNFVKYILIYDDKHVYYIMILFKQLYCLSCCHLTFRKIFIILLNSLLIMVSVTYYGNKYFMGGWTRYLTRYYTIIVFCWGQYEFLCTLKTIFTEAFRLRWILIFKVHKNLYFKGYEHY
jgi:hypothetical protein